MRTGAYRKERREAQQQRKTRDIIESLYIKRQPGTEVDKLQGGRGTEREKDGTCLKGIDEES